MSHDCSICRKHCAFIEKFFKEQGIEDAPDVNYSLLSIECKKLTKLAAKQAGFDDKLDNILKGQVAIAFSEDPTAPARVIKNFKKDNEDLLEVLGLIFDGKVYPSEKYKEFANLPSKEESLTKVVIMLNQPLTKFASALNNSFTKLLSALTNLKETKN